jgi:hypothetical protein
VPFPLPWKATPGGNAPDSDKLGAGAPAATIVNDPAVPATNVVRPGLVIAAELLTVIVKS